MSIKSDRWIKKMAHEHGLIEPFEEGQVRKGVVSYGLSSYGYDLRVAEDFKVFTNVHATLVDPKAFDEKAFVDIVGDHCIIPPNSFALARTVEYLRIPRNVITICLGKSTYARCFHAGTRVALVDGSAPTLEDMARRAETGEAFFGYSIDADGKLIVAALEAPRFIGSDSLLELQLDSGATIKCTPDHLMMRRDGRYVAAQNLRPGDSLMPLYREADQRRERVYQPRTGRWSRTLDLADEWNLANGVYTVDDGAIAAPRDGDPSNAHPLNIERISIPTRLRRSHQRHSDLMVPHHSLARRLRHLKTPARSALQAQLIGPYAADSAARHAAAGRALRNHKITAIRELPGEHDVYCLTVPEAGNFALDAGVFVKNCGIIVNVTPFEPEWEGHATLEISNTTPLPAKIYANEGLCQVLFFESDEACEISYKDRKGKYDAQPPKIVLPRM